MDSDNVHMVHETNGISMDSDQSGPQLLRSAQPRHRETQNRRTRGPAHGISPDIRPISRDPAYLARLNRQPSQPSGSSMATATATATSVAAALLLSLLLARARGDDDYSGFVYAGCSQGRYASGTQYASDVDSVLTSVANSAPYSPYANFTSPTSNSVVGVYQCRSDLPASVCTGCVRSAISRLSSLCAWATGGAVQLRACFVRYGNDTFLGKQDTSVLFKKCGGSPGDA
uniref:Gnk2-homologous domain-containing protein n=1 Tax=Oryza glumipatula TaxID=40148 RepID=A0A0D9YXX1_9ORYZ